MCVVVLELIFLTFNVILFVQELFRCHDVIKKRQYEKPTPQLESSTPFIHINRDSYKTVGLHKSADEPLVSPTH